MSEWFTAAELAALKLPGLPTTERGIRKTATALGWQGDANQWHATDNPHGVWRKREGQRGGGIEYHVALLPSPARAKVQAKAMADRQDAPVSRAEAKARAAREQAWQWFDDAPEAKKERAKRKHRALIAVHDLVRNGTAKDAAVRLVGKDQGFSASSFYGWEGKVAGVPREDWLPYLVDAFTGRTVTADISPEAWDIFKADYLRLEEPQLAECYNRLVRANVEGGRGWVIPAAKTLLRKIEREVGHRVIVLLRQGREAHDRLYPSQRRDRSGFHAMQALNYDGHKLDLFVQWPDKTKTERAFLLAFQDLYSGKFVGWRIDRSENAFGFRLAFLDAAARFGFPEIVYSDNTMAAAAKENTGGTRFRHRFKVKEDDPVGLFTQFGIDLRFTKPAHGQSKPIERAFGDLSRYISKAPECKGAYTGNNPGNKPANYGSKAISLETLIKVCEREIAWFNARIDRDGVTARATSYDAMFEESYKDAIIRKPTPEQLRPWMLACEPVTCRKPDGAVYLHENRYWNEHLLGMIGKKVVLRFDPDHLHDPVHVYRLDGSFVCTADCLMPSRFDSKDDAKEHAAKLKRFAKTTKEMAEYQRAMSIDDVAAVQPSLVGALPPEQRVVRPVFGAAKTAPETAAETSEQTARRVLIEADFTRPSTPVEADPATVRFDRAVRAERQIAAGEPVADAERRWLERYRETPEYRARRRAVEDFEVFGSGMLA